MGCLLTRHYSSRRPFRLLIRAYGQDELDMNTMKDAFVLLKRHTCKTPELDKFVSNPAAYIENQEAPLRKVDDLGRQCQREHVEVPAKQSADDYYCFLGGVTQSPVTRAERKMLNDNVWENAQKIMRAHPKNFPFCRKS